MIRFKDKVYEDYFIDPETAVITDKDGNVQKVKVVRGRPYWKGMAIHRLQAYTAWGWIPGHEVHHIDENKMNNSLRNLDYSMTKGQHTTHHMLGNRNFEGHHHSKEAKQKISDSRTGIEFTEEHKEHLSIAHLGQKAWNKGIETPVEVKAKLSAAKKGRSWWNNGIRSSLSYGCPRCRLD